MKAKKKKTTTKKKKTTKKISIMNRILGRDRKYDDFDDFEEIDEMDLDTDMTDDYDREIENIMENDTEEDLVQRMPSDETDQDLQINLVDKSKKLIAQAVIPGLSEDQIDINLTREMLTISTNSNDHCIEKGGDYLYEELIFGSFSRSILLPAEVEVEESTAEIKDGILTINMPKINKAAQKKLGVKKK